MHPCVQDLHIGATVVLHARPMTLYACDGFTRRWYQEQLGFTAEELQDLDVKEPVRCMSSHVEMIYGDTCGTRSSAASPTAGIRSSLAAPPRSYRVSSGRCA